MSRIDHPAGPSHSLGRGVSLLQAPSRETERRARAGASAGPPVSPLPPLHPLHHQPSQSLLNSPSRGLVRLLVVTGPRTHRAEVVSPHGVRGKILRGTSPSLVEAARCKSQAPLTGGPGLTRDRCRNSQNLRAIIRSTNQSRLLARGRKCLRSDARILRIILPCPPLSHAGPGTKNQHHESG